MTTACQQHTPEPNGYLRWHSWADRMARTHRQLRCPDCGLYKIWVPKRGLPALDETPEEQQP
jgi:hypothetical protein